MKNLYYMLAIIVALIFVYILYNQYSQSQTKWLLNIYDNENSVIFRAELATENECNEAGILYVDQESNTGIRYDCRYGCEDFEKTDLVTIPECEKVCLVDLNGRYMCGLNIGAGAS